MSIHNFVKARKILTLFLGCVGWFLGGEAKAQFTFATDNAGNSAYSDGWASGDNGGSGFGSWTISTTNAAAGVFIGNPANNGMGTTGIGTTAFGLFSSANNSGYVNATRDFNTGLQVGDTLSFRWAMNWDSFGGAKGFDLKTSTGANVFNVNNGGSSTNTITAGAVASTMGGYGTTPMLVTATRTTNGYSFSMTSRTNSSVVFTTNLVTTSAISRINLYEGNQGDNNANRNIYFNNFAISNSGVFNQGGTVTNANTFTGTGNLSVGNNTTIVMSGGGNQNYSGTTTIDGGSTLRLAGSGTSGFVSAISGSGALSVGSGTVTLSGANSGFTGKTAVTGGTLSIDSDARLGAAPGAATADQLTLGGGTLATTASFSLAQNRGMTLSSGSVSTLNVAAGTDLTYNGVTAGGGGLGKNGTGTLILGGANAHTGQMFLREGTILLANDQALGGGTFMFSFATNTAKTLASLGGATRQITNAIQIYNDATLGQSTGNTGSLNFSGTVDLGSDAGVRILTTASGTTHTLSGVVSGTRGIVKKGEGTLLLTGNNTFSGTNYFVQGITAVAANNGVGTGTQYLGETWGSDAATLVLAGSGITMANAIVVRSGSSGTKRIEAYNTSGTSTMSGVITLDASTTLGANYGGALALTGATANLAADTILTVTNSSAVTIANQLITAGDALLVKRGSGTLALSNGSNYGDMRYDLYGGTLEVSQEGNLGNASTFKANKVYLDGGTLKATESFVFQANNGITIGSNGGTFEVAATKTLELQQYLNDMSNTGVSLSKTGAGTLSLARGTSYDLSGTTWKVTEGTLSTWNPNGNLSATTELGGAATTGTFRFQKSDGAFSTDRSFLVNAGGGKIDVAADALTVTGTLSGSGAFTKEGSGRLTLSGTNTLSGNTTVAAGSLVVNGTLSNSEVLVQNGASIGGSGTVSALTIASGGTLAAGNSPGELTVLGNVIWNGGGSYDWEINTFPGTAGTNWDFLDIGGTLTINASAENRFIIDVISLLSNNSALGSADGFDALNNYSFAIATAAGGISAFDSSWFQITSGSFANSMNPAGATAAGSWGVARDGNSIMLNYTAATAATAIPEPNSLALVGIGLVALAQQRRRKE
ncbi:MAG: hypothetical protein RL549_47 [Verrucomicrobiota bacterium]|jgi:autotransporter-associated beta strand protein